MKKILSFFLISSCVVIFSLSYVEYVILDDNAIDLIDWCNSAEILNVADASEISYIPGDDSKFKVSSDSNTLLYTSNQLLYSLDLSSMDLKMLNTDTFVSDFCFLDTDYVLFACKKKSEVDVYLLYLPSENCELLGSLSYKNFIGLSNAYMSNDLIFFDIEYLYNNDKCSRSYVYEDDIIRRADSVSIFNLFNINDVSVYEDKNNNIYINGSIFSYNGVSKYSILGVNNNDNLLYLLNKETNVNVVSLKVGDSIDILEDINISGLDYRDVLVTDGIYLISDNSVIDLNNSLKIGLDRICNIVYVSKNSIYFVVDNTLMKINY